MAQYEYPTEIAVAAYKNGDETAVAQQLLGVCTHCPERAREFAEEAAKAVAANWCEHTEPPPQLENGLTLEERRKAAADHVGLCGRYQAGVIALIDTGAVLAQWETTAGTKYRNQAAFEAAKSLRAYGKGVQIPRRDCFAHACRALWNGDEEVPPAVRDAFV